MNLSSGLNSALGVVGVVSSGLLISQCPLVVGDQLALRELRPSIRRGPTSSAPTATNCVLARTYFIPPSRLPIPSRRGAL